MDVTLADHPVKFWTRRRHDDEPRWLGKHFVVVCDLDNTPVYEDLEGVYVHWDGTDPLPQIAGGRLNAT